MPAYRGGDHTYGPQCPKCGGRCRFMQSRPRTKTHRSSTSVSSDRFSNFPPITSRKSLPRRTLSSKIERFVFLIVNWGVVSFLAVLLCQSAVNPTGESMAGMVKLVDPPGANLYFSALSNGSGIALFEPTIRFSAGVFEIVLAVLLIMPKTRKIGSLFTAALMTIYLIFQFSPWFVVNPIHGQRDTVSLLLGQVLVHNAAMLIGSAILIFTDSKSRP